MVSTTAVLGSQFTEQFKKFIEGETNAAMKRLREEAFARFAESGFPTPKQEDWKYTDVRPIVKTSREVFPDQIFPEQFTAENLDLVRAFNVERNGFTALNRAFAQYLVIVIPKGSHLTNPINLDLGARARKMFCPGILIVAESGSKATVVEAYKSESGGLVNSAVQIFVEENANLTHYRVQKDATDSFNVGTTEVTLGAGSRYDSTNINLGGAISRHDIELKFIAEGGEAFVDGLYMLNGSQHSDTHSAIDHLVPNCTSHQTYKGVLNDKSRGVFNGKVFVRANAHGTDARQSNKNLLLSNDARVDTKPQLEIDNDDVKCSHGATVGQLEEEELFYLLTRGLPDMLARNLLTYGFAEEIINKIGVNSIKAELDETVLNRLNARI